MCGFVAALLQYLFLSAFCWMMCEGVMLYLMLIVVFSRVSKKWWFFLILGYCEFAVVSSVREFRVCYHILQALLFCLWLLDMQFVWRTMECMARMEILPCKAHTLASILLVTLSLISFAVAGCQQRKGPSLLLCFQ